MYQPPFKVTARIVNLVAEISSLLERVKISMEKTDVRLRKVNRMKTIRGSLAIEGNSLSEEQVTALIEGRPVLAPLKEIQEVRNAIMAYEQFMSFKPYAVASLLKAHEILALGLVDNPGSFRKSGVCVAGKEGLTHIAPPAERVPFLVADLFAWLKAAEDHILIKSSVFHYEFEFIHPFEDGNGRTGRFWQSRLLAEWNPVFEFLPVENMIWENQAEYYRAIEESTDNTDSGIFVEFMLQVILKALQEHVSDNVNDNVNDNVKITANQKKIIAAIKENPFIKQEELSVLLGITVANVSRNMKKLQDAKIIQRVGADKNGRWVVISSLD